MSAPFVWDDSRNVSTPPAMHRDGPAHRRQLRDFSVHLAERAFTVAFRPPAVLAFSRVDTVGTFTPAVNNTWAKVTTFATVVGDPIFDVAASEYKHTALTILPGRQNRYASAAAGVLVENTGGAQRFVEVGFGLGAAPVRYIHSFFVPAGATMWVQVHQPRVEMTAAVALWMKGDVAADVHANATTWIALELGARWR